MSARLSTAIRIGEAADAILKRVKSFEKESLWGEDDLNEYTHVGVEPMLLALSMELALKAWFVFDHDTSEVIRSHNLSKLFESLAPESQNRLDGEFKRSVAPYHPSGLYNDYEIRHILSQHANAFVDWPYLHEPKKGMMFDQSGFLATLEMVLREFKKRYRVEEVPPIRQSK